MKKFKSIVFVIVVVMSMANGWANKDLVKLIEGNYSSKDKDCTEQSLLFVHSEKESFYLIGRNKRFILEPSETEVKSLIRGCTVLYRSKVEKNTLLQEKVELPCVNPIDGKDKGVSKEKTVSQSILIIEADNKFILRKNNKSCRYQLK